MALLAEQLVDEWMNRQGFFTRRGLKSGVSEIDILGVRTNTHGLEGWHVEVQVSFRPVGYLGQLSDEDQRKLGVTSPNSAKQRQSDMIERAVGRWIEKKFDNPIKIRMRNEAWSNISDWKKVFIHGVMREPAELEYISQAGISVVDFFDVLRELCDNHTDGFEGGAGTDIAEILEFYKNDGKPRRMGKRSAAHRIPPT